MVKIDKYPPTALGYNATTQTTDIISKTYLRADIGAKNSTYIF